MRLPAKVARSVKYLVKVTLPNPPHFASPTYTGAGRSAKGCIRIIRLCKIVYVESKIVLLVLRKGYATAPIPFYSSAMSSFTKTSKVRMEEAIALSSSLDQDLEDAVCLLALITSRQPDLAQPLVPAESLHDGTCDDSDGLQELGILSVIDVDHDEQYAICKLRDQVLDRLAETLARFKGATRGRPFDAKHVSSTMMVFDEEQRISKIMCAKNEGLDKADEDFLDKWTACIKAISTKGELMLRTTALDSTPIFDRDCIGRR